MICIANLYLGRRNVFGFDILTFSNKDYASKSLLSLYLCDGTFVIELFFKKWLRWKAV